MDEKRSDPSYYHMGENNEDIFHFLRKLPIPPVINDALMAVIGVWTTGFRYARRCIWKGLSEKEMASDARKAATCFHELAELLEKSTDSK